MNARWMNAEIATCAIAGRAANRVGLNGKATLWLYQIIFLSCRAAVATQRVAHPKNIWWTTDIKSHYITESVG